MTQTVKPNPQIFREYDIRGIADTDLSSDVITAIGKAYGTLLIHEKKNKVTVGHDCRLSANHVPQELCLLISIELK